VLGFFFCGANNTFLLVVAIDRERKYEALKKHGIDLIEMAKQGKLDPVIGHDEEIDAAYKSCLEEQKIILYSLASLV
jgi:ATP-dependent Clp protease ATP-binding subunit ClpA